MTTIKTTKMRKTKLRLLQIWYNIRRRKSDIIEYTKSFAKKKASKVFKYPKFNNRHYQESELILVLKIAAECCKNLADEECMGNANIMKLRINETTGKLYNIMTILGKDNSKNS